MNSLLFLLTRSLKNTFLELLRKPGKLILWILVIAMLGGALISSLSTRQSGGADLDIVWLKGIFFLLIALFVALAIQKGLSNGDVIFDMSDVNLLFVSPLNPRLILMYGIVRMAKMAFWAGFFILFQGSSLNNSFGIGFDAVLVLLLGFMLAVSLLQILSLLIYSLTNGKPARKLMVRVLAVLVFLPLVFYTGMQLLRTGDLLSALNNTLRSPFTAWTPVAGWASEGAVSLISGDIGKGSLFFGLLVLSGALQILYIALSNPDYYEDVLVATETAFEKKRVISEGQINTEASSIKKVKLAKTGISGIGASAIFHKHLRESFRSNRLGLWGLSSVITVLGAALFSIFMHGNGNGMIILLQILMWMQLFMIGTGRGLRELYMHYIYLIPDSSFSKIVWSNLEIGFKVLVESLFIFCISGLITGSSVPMIAAAIAVYSLFSFLLLGINYLSMRWTGADISAGLLIFIYTIAVIIIMLPGLTAAVIVGTGYGFLPGCGILALWELFAALGCFALSKGVLHNSDMPVIKAGK